MPWTFHTDVVSITLGSVRGIPSTFPKSWIQRTHTGPLTCTVFWSVNAREVGSQHPISMPTALRDFLWASRVQDHFTDRCQSIHSPGPGVCPTWTKWCECAAGARGSVVEASAEDPLYKAHIDCSQPLLIPRWSWRKLPPSWFWGWDAWVSWWHREWLLSLQLDRAAGLTDDI